MPAAAEPAQEVKFTPLGQDDEPTTVSPAADAKSKAEDDEPVTVGKPPLRLVKPEDKGSGSAVVGGLTLRIGNAQDIGKRPQQQDAFAITPLEEELVVRDHGVMAVVCDGMGGAKSGNIASTLAVEVFVEEIRRSWLPGMESDRIDQMLRSAVKLANFTVYDQAAQFEEFDGMGTTLVAVLVRRDRATVVNVGDSRAYGISRTGIRQISKDHSLVQMMVDRGDIPAEAAKTYPGKNYITRAVGTEPVLICDIFHVSVSKGDFLLLCSDGLSNLMDDQEILFEVAHGVNKHHCCKRLLNIAKSRGAPDNVTSVLIQV